MSEPLLERLSTAAFGVPASESRAAGVCVRCQKVPDLATFSPAGVAEWGITGMCEPCFDFLFADDEADYRWLVEKVRTALSEERP
jgi:hypothetical protein